MDSSGMIHRGSSSPDAKGAHAYDEKHGGYDAEQQHIRGIETSAETSLHRGLKARHITMIAIGGAIGTGLIVGTGKALAQAGPGSILISYSIVGFMVFLVMAALGEMAAWLPMSAGFTGYASRFCDPSLGFALGWTYWCKYIIVTPNQLTAAALIIQYWVPRERINPGVFITIFLIAIVVINYFGIRFFGEFEFWLSSFKVIVIVGIILLCLCIATGAADGDARGFRFWSNPGAFVEYPKGSGPVGKFAGLWSTMVTATFAYLGTELVGVTVGEAQNPRKTIPRAIKLTFYRIVFFYVISIFLLGMCVPYNSEVLAFANGNAAPAGTTVGSSASPKVVAGAAASPFVVAAQLAHIKYLDHILNGCILVFVFSAANSDLYIASRTLYGLASDGSAPAIFRRTDKKGLPIYALGASTLFALLAYLNVADDSKEVFSYFVNLTTIFGLLSWISILTTHIWFVRGRRAQGLSDSQMPYTAPLGIWGSYGALAACIIVALTKNYDVFLNFSIKKNQITFVTAYIGIPIYLILIFGHKFWTKSKGVKPHEMDFYSGKDVIDREEAEFLAQKEARAEQNAGGAFYKKWISWLL